MELSIFDVLGPVMIGPSSSHTAGAARLGRVAALIAAKPFTKVSFGLSGSFAKTGLGHGTHKALLAGALGFVEWDENIRDIEEIAAREGVQAEYHEEDLSWLHANAAHITFFHTGGSTTQVWGCSLGGGRIEIRRINSLNTRFSAENPTFVIPHTDRPGVVSDISRIFAENGVNIAVMRLTRVQRGSGALAILEVDGHVPHRVIEDLRRVPTVTEVVFVEL